MAYDRWPQTRQLRSARLGLSGRGYGMEKWLPPECETLAVNILIWHLPTAGRYAYLRGLPRGPWLRPGEVLT